MRPEKGPPGGGAEPGYIDVKEAEAPSTVPEEGIGKRCPLIVKGSVGCVEEDLRATLAELMNPDRDGACGGRKLARDSPGTGCPGPLDM